MLVRRRSRQTYHEPQSLLESPTGRSGRMLDVPFTVTCGSCGGRGSQLIAFNGVCFSQKKHCKLVKQTWHDLGGEHCRGLVTSFWLVWESHRTCTRIWTYEYQWISMNINEYQWIPMNTNEDQWRSMKINEDQWISMKINDTYYIRIYVYYIYPTLSFVPKMTVVQGVRRWTCNWRICVVTLWPQSTTVNPLRPWFPWVRQEIPWLGES